MSSSPYSAQEQEAIRKDKTGAFITLNQFVQKDSGKRVESCAFSLVCRFCDYAMNKDRKPSEKIQRMIDRAHRKKCPMTKEIKQNYNYFQHQSAKFQSNSETGNIKAYARAKGKTGQQRDTSLRSDFDTMFSVYLQPTLTPHQKKYKNRLTTRLTSLIVKMLNGGESLSSKQMWEMLGQQDTKLLEYALDHNMIDVDMIIKSITHMDKEKAERLLTSFNRYLEIMREMREIEMFTTQYANN